MISSSRPSTLAGRRDLDLHGPVAPELVELVTAVRAVVSGRADWRQTARLVAAELTRHLPSSHVLTPEQRIGDPANYRSHLLHTEPDGAFSIVALVWRPGQVTPIHDHVTWCVFGVIQGIEYEELFVLDPERECLVETGTNTNGAGEVSVLFESLHGAPKDADGAPGPVGYRHAAFNVSAMAVWQDVELDQNHISWARDTAAAVEPWSVSGGYMNYMQADEPIDRVRSAFGDEAFERLQALKRRYDPTNVLRRNQNIPPR
jgi:3-mercaptopropionate dioxygenase